MSSPIVEDLNWYRAATLVERLAAGPLPPTTEATESPTEDELTHYRWQSWQAQPPFDEAAAWAQRLALDNLTELQLHHLVAEPLEALPARFPEPPAWLPDLRTALAQPTTSDFRQLLADKWKRKPESGFLNAAAPFIEHALARFEQGVAALITNASALPFDPSTIKQICFANLPGDLLDILARTMALELNIARLSGELEGATPEARFQSFTERLREPEQRRALFSHYPVLARLLSEQAQRWVEISLEFLAQLCRDWAEIKATFAPDSEPGVLVKLKGGLTDTQRGGRTIFIAKFSSGFRLVYKPKPLAVDAHFQELLQWVNERGADPSFPLLRVLPREQHGWVEFVATRACETVEEVRRFYRRQGGYLALLYLIDATDFHSANLIACAEQPYLIDLEALFHPHRSRTTDDASDSADKLAGRALAHSVLRIGLLPRRSWGNSEHVGIDRSGLGMMEGQMTPHALPRWEGKGTDTMHLVRERLTVSAQKNHPQLGGAEINVLDYRQELEDGFVATYELLLAQRDALLADDSPLARFAEDEVCVFLRSSRTYRRLLEESYHPDVLHDALDRDRLFDALWAEVEDDAALAGVIRAERDELQCGDTPLFTTRPNSPDVLLQGGGRIPDFFAEASLTTVQHRLEQLNAADCVRQAWFIRASLATMPTAPRQMIKAPAPTSELNRASLHAEARAIGDRLEALSIRGSDDASWLGLMQEREREWFVDLLGLDLAGGLPGVALFQAYLGNLTGEERYTALAQKALTTMQRQIAEWGDAVTMIGAFDGWGGVIYTLTHLGVLWQRADLLAEAEAVVARLPELIAEDKKYDVYGGAAGCIAGLSCLAQVAPSERVTAAAIQCGDHLLARTQQRPAEHGTAGIAWALQRLHDWTGLERFRQVGPEALQSAVELGGTPLAVETPGLLAGLAGIGYELLRRAEPELVPSVLALEPPLRRPESERESRHV